MKKRSRSRGKKKARAARKAVTESGRPGGGSGRIDDVGKSGVYPMSGGPTPGGHAELRTMPSWGQGDRGAAGYEDSGGSELSWRNGQLLGGLTSGPGGEPTIDIHAKPPVTRGKVPKLPRGELPALPRRKRVEKRDEDEEC